MLTSRYFRLRTLGQLTLSSVAGETESAAVVRPRHLAVLTVLALSSRSVSRDALLEMFWGGETEVRARHSLSNALSGLRSSARAGRHHGEARSRRAGRRGASRSRCAAVHGRVRSPRRRKAPPRLYGGAFLDRNPRPGRTGVRRVAQPRARAARPTVPRAVRAPRSAADSRRALARGRVARRAVGGVRTAIDDGGRPRCCARTRVRARPRPSRARSARTIASANSSPTATAPSSIRRSRRSPRRCAINSAKRSNSSPSPSSRRSRRQ